MRRRAPPVGATPVEEVKLGVRSHDEVVHLVMTSLLIRVIGFFVSVAAFYAVFKYIGPVRKKGDLTVVLFSLLFVANAVLIATYLWLWMKMFVHETIMGFLALLIPGMIVWRWALFNLDLTKEIIITHYIALFVVLSSSYLIAVQIDRPFMDVTTLLLHFTEDESILDRDFYEDRSGDLLQYSNSNFQYSE